MNSFYVVNAVLFVALVLAVNARPMAPEDKELQNKIAQAVEAAVDETLEKEILPELIAADKEGGTGSDDAVDVKGENAAVGEKDQVNVGKRSKWTKFRDRVLKPALKAAGKMLLMSSLAG